MASFLHWTEAQVPLVPPQAAATVARRGDSLGYRSHFPFTP